MREKINRLARGIVDTDVLQVNVVPESVEEAIQAGELTKKELYVTDLQGRFIKGLVYSSNPRVRIHKEAFGGNRNHITYEIDGRNLSKDDVISGAFYLVTNGGERKVPFSFSVDIGVSGKVLDGLQTAGDLAELVHRDQELALRLFEYQDFAEAPFMQDLRVRALYDGLKGRPNRQNQLEEFLVVQGAKKPVSLSVDTRARRYEGLSDIRMDLLEIKAGTWGAVSIEVMAEGDFLELPRKSFERKDFKDQSCMVSFAINPGRLHRGKNLGVIHVRTIRQQFDVPIEAVGEDESAEPRQKGRKKSISRYLKMRLEYETVSGKRRQALAGKLKQELEVQRETEGENARNALCLAELYVVSGEREHAMALLESCRAQVNSQRMDDRVMYSYFQYLLYRIQQKPGQREGLLRLVRQNESIEKKAMARGYLYLIQLLIDPDQAMNPAGTLDEMHTLFAQGCTSPWMYMQALKIFEEDVKLLRRLDEFEMQVMSFGARRGLISEELAKRIAQLSVTVRPHRVLHYRMLRALYEKYENKELLSALCGVLIRSDCRDKRYFSWYQRALKEGVSLTRLYEYYLYSLPEDYAYLLPREVLLYFSYEKSLDEDSRASLYVNILRYMNPESELYKKYERDMEKFAMDQLLKSRINSRIAVLYEHMLYKEMIDEKVARVLPSVLRSYRIQIDNPSIRYVVVCSGETEGQDAFPIKDGTAYVPLFSENPVLLFQDEYGNRYANLPFKKLPAMAHKEERELEARCYEVFPEHPMLRLQECRLIVENGISDDGQLIRLREASEEMRFNLLFRRRVLSRILEYDQRMIESDAGELPDDVEYLARLDLTKMNNAERGQICEILTWQGYYRDAFDIMCTYGWESVRSARLLKLCSGMILKEISGRDDRLVLLACKLFSEGRYDDAVLDYLCEYFNGSTKQMFKVLSQSVRDHIALYDLPERLLAQMMFSGETDRLDQVFDWYVDGKATSELVVRAYFTTKSVDYFLHEKIGSGRVFDYLERVMNKAEDKSRVPTIYLLALCRHYASMKTLSEEQKELARKIVDLLISEGRVFAWFHDLGRLMPMPDGIMDKVIVEYHGDRDSRPELMARVLPDEEQYAPEELRKVYPGIYVHQKVLFEGELLEYQVYDRKDGKRVLVDEGSISCDIEMTSSAGNRFASLNEMGLCLSLKEEGTLKDKMKKYLTDSAVMEELFGLM